MTWRVGLVTLLAPAIVFVILVMGALFLANVRSSEAIQPTVGLTAEAALVSSSGSPMGTVTFRQGATGVLIMAEVTGLTPGGHALAIHENGSCAPEFEAAGDHFNPTEADHGVVHPAWKRSDSGGGHGGDLPNIYAAADGSARADFFTTGITLDSGRLHSIFDDNGSAIIVHEHPDAYGERESNTGQRIACGVITRG